VFTPQSHNQKYCSYTCRRNAKIEKSELQTPITADVEHQIKQLVAKFGEKKVREVLDPLINGME
jgi:carbon monoxide dehydrogenase subunit G